MATNSVPAEMYREMELLLDQVDSLRSRLVAIRQQASNRAQIRRVLKHLDDAGAELDWAIEEAGVAK